MGTETKKKKAILLWLDFNVFKKIDSLCKKTDRSRTNLINKIIKDYLEVER